MSLSKLRNSFDKERWFRIIILVIGGVLGFIILVIPLSANSQQYFLSIGDVATRDFQAPQSKTYISAILTNNAIQEAESAVQPVFLPVDPKISRTQIDKFRKDLNYLDSVRSDQYATFEQKFADISALENIRISRDNATIILSFTDQEWVSVQTEAIRVLEQIMRTSIREDKIEEIQRTAPSLISFSLPDNQFSIVAALVSGYIVPNSLYSPEMTAEAQQAAKASIEPVTKSYVQGEIIVNRGEIITPEIWEALIEFNIVEQTHTVQTTIAKLSLVLLICAFLAVYYLRRNVRVIHEPKNLMLIFFNFFAFLVASRMILPGQEFIPYFFPLPAFGLILSFLFNLEIGLVFSTVLAVVSAYGLSNSLEFTVFYIFTSFLGILVLNRGRRIAHFFWSSIAIGLAGSSVILAYRLPFMLSDVLKLSVFISLSIVNGLASASISLLLQFVYSQLFGITTPLRLLDISRSDHPLLQQILLNSPGTYQHSLQVSNLAEQAAKSINADTLLVRAGALYHDAGKSTNPSYFIENQLPGFKNPHDDLEPIASAKIIIQHIPDGVALAKKHRLPPRIIDFILEHHGTLKTPYQYSKEVERLGSASEVNIKDFQYPGPSPRSRETAILMIADGVEARFRAKPPANEEELLDLIQKTITFLSDEQQLINTNLTLCELNKIAQSMHKTLMNARHMRIQYPEIKK